MAFTPAVNWKNLPTKTTPVSAENIKAESLAKGPKWHQAIEKVAAAHGYKLVKDDG